MSVAHPDTTSTTAAPAPPLADEKGRTSIEHSSQHSSSGKGADQAVSAADLASLAAAGHAVPTDGHGHPLVHIDPVAERKLRWKCDLCLTPIAALMYLFCFIDRTNIGNARIAGLERDLGMSGYDYNVALTMFYVSYIVFEIPSVMMCKIVGPGKWLPFCTFWFGFFTMIIGFVESYGALLAVRFLLGIAETALLPGLAFWMSRFYRRNELVFRLSLYIVTAPLAGAFGGLLAYGLEQFTIGKWTTSLPDSNWRSIFIVESLLTMAIGIAAYFLMADRPETARWLTADEKILAAARIKADAPATQFVTEALNREAFWSGIFNVNSVTCGLLFLLNQITIQGLTVFFPTILASLYPGTSVPFKQVKTIPPYVVGAASVVISSWLAWKTHHIGVFMMLGAMISVVAYGMYIGSRDTNVRYGASFLITIGAFPYGAFATGWSTKNAAPDSARNGAISCTSFLGNLGGLIATWTYLPYMAPNYVIGHSINAGAASLCILIAGGLWLYQIRENRLRAAGRRDDRLAGKTEGELAMLGHRHPEFRYSP